MEALKVAGIELSQNEANDYANKFTRYFSFAVTTPRKAKLYGNILLFSLPILKGEVDVVELMLIECKLLDKSATLSDAWPASYTDSW